MLDIRKINLLDLGRNELLDVTKKELEYYKVERQSGLVSNNLPRLKTLERIDKRLGVFALGDSEILEGRNEVKQLLNEDVYKKTSPKGRILSNYEIKQNHYKNFIK